MIRNLSDSTRTLALVMVVAVIGLAIFPVIGHTAPQRAQPRRYFQSTGPLAGLPFSNAVLVDNTLYIAGHIGTDDTSGQAPADRSQEIKLLFDHFLATLTQAGLTVDNLVSVNVYCTDLSLYDTFNTAYRNQFSREFPARAFVGVASLLRGAHFEMEGVAVR